MLKPNRFLPFLLSIIFAVFAVSHIPQSDEHLWVVIYGSTAAISGFAIFEKFHKLTLLTMLSGYLVGLIYFISELYQNTVFSSGEEYSISLGDLQNLAGLVICLIALCHYMIQAQKYSIKTKEENTNYFPDSFIKNA